MTLEDSKVLRLLLKGLLDCEESIGVLVDGFPRTERQVEFIQMLKKKMLELRQEFAAKGLQHEFR
jgi:adenylate kinase